MQEANLEYKHEDVYGKTFSLYDRAEMQHFIRPFEIRYERNALKPQKLFSGKKCLDAGCGNGRGSIFMAQHGADEIQSLDISSTNIESTQRNAQLFGFDKVITPQLSSLEKISFPDESFDFVWCNGVIMHTHNPDACLKEISRVLKKGGKAWIYVYGSGGVYWYCVYNFRKLLKTTSEEDCMKVMKLSQTPVSYLAEYMDDWKAPYLRTYTNHDFSQRLQELGFSNPTPLAYGTDYDTSYRNTLFPEDKDWVGEGDLRYLITKTSNVTTNLYKIDGSGTETDYLYPRRITDLLDVKFEILSNLVKGDLLRTILAFAYIQRNLRDNFFADAKPFDYEKFLHLFDDVTSLLS